MRALFLFMRQDNKECSLRDLRSTDKKKVANLLRQVVELQQEIEGHRSRTKVSTFNVAAVVSHDLLQQLASPSECTCS